jgi:hypothetical protein
LGCYIGKQSAENYSQAAEVSAQPVFDSKISDPREFTLIIGNHCVTERQRMSGDQQVVCADGLSSSLQVRSELTINGIDGRF